MKDSLLMRDSTEGDGKAEIVMDYIMSYSLRHAESKYLIEKPTLCRYCRYMLGKLLNFNINNNMPITSVKVWREWKHIDLRVEVTIGEEKTGDHYAILIENKYYGKLRENQLSDYKKVFDEYYNAKGIPETHRRYKLISCFENEEDVKDIYGKEIEKVKPFTALPFYDLINNDEYWHEKDNAYEETESDIFNEFWLRKW